MGGSLCGKRIWISILEKGGGGERGRKGEKDFFV